MKTHSTWAPLTATGWAALSLGTAIPVLFGIGAMWRLRNGRCTTELFYSFAPMLITCGTPSEAEAVVGWTLAVLSVGSFILAVLMSLYAVVRLARAPRRFPSKTQALTLFTTTLAMIVAAATVLASRPDEAWGTNSWIFLSALAAAGVLLAATAIVPVILFAQRRMR